MNRFKQLVSDAGLALRDHQVAALRWGLTRERGGALAGRKVVRGGILADEMGLGKTIEMLGLMHANPLPSTLIVVPLALVDQWIKATREILKEEPLLYHGPARRNISISELEEAPIVITTYGMTALGEDSPRRILHEHRWSRIIWDEAHHLRNGRTRAHIGAMRLRSSIRWLVTGTPIQNRKSDFYSLCSALGLPAAFYVRQANLMQIARTFLMKRTAAQAGVTLPGLRSTSEEVEWQCREEREMAEEIHAQLSFSGVPEAHPQMVEKSLSSPAFGNTLLGRMVRARQACVLPPLLRAHLEELSATGQLPLGKEAAEALRSASKLNAVVAKIKGRSANGHKKLVFCHYRGEMDYLMARMRRAAISVGSIDGRTPKPLRKRLLTASPPDVLLLQIQTGCEGLNLQQFSEVYFPSPHWNPAVEDQAVARCHRIGQAKEVSVFRFVMSPFDADLTTTSLDGYCGVVQARKRCEMLELDSMARPPTPGPGATPLATPGPPGQQIRAPRISTATEM